MRSMRLTASLGLLLACMLLAAFASTASATSYDMRGAWSMEFTSNGEAPLSETGIINQMNNGTGAFSGTLHATIGVTSSIEGTLSGTTVSLKSVTPTPIGVITFITNSVTLNTTTNKLSGMGTYYVNGNVLEPGEVTGTRLKTYMEVEEQEAREKREQEERTARVNVRGEWALTLAAGPETLKGVALISEEATSENKFASSSAVFESSTLGTFSGTLEGSKASVTVTTEAAGQLPPGTFTSTTVAVTSTTDSMSMSGSGTLTFGGMTIPGTLTAMRVRTHQQIAEQEAQGREAKEKEAQEAAEKTARERKEGELKEREAAAAKNTPVINTPVSPTTNTGNPTNTGNALMPVDLAAKTLKLGHSDAISLDLTNPGGSPVHGHLKLTLTKTGKASRAKHTTGSSQSSTLGEASFSIAGHGTEVVKVKLSKSGRAQLARLKSLRVLVTVTTQAGGHPDITKSYAITLRAPSSGANKG